jgi:hypothetical protein
MVEDGVTDGEIILVIAIRPIPVHAATIANGVAKDATVTKVLAQKVGMRAVVGMTAVVAMNVVTEVVHVETARAVAAVRDDRTRTRAMRVVAIRVNEPKARARTATKGARILQDLPAAVTKGNAVTLLARCVPSNPAAPIRMGAMIEEAISTVATRHWRTRASHRTISATGAERRESREAPAARRGATESKVSKPMATDPPVTALNGIVAAVDADAVDAVAVAVARVEIARVARPRKAVGQRTRLPRRRHQCRRLTVATNMVAAKFSTTVVVRVARGTSSQTSVT